MVGAPLSWKKLEYDPIIEWNGWSIKPALMTAQLPTFKQTKISLLIDTLLQNPCRKNIEKKKWRPTLGHILSSSCPIPAHINLQRPLRYPGDQLQYPTYTVGIFPWTSQ